MKKRHRNKDEMEELVIHLGFSTTNWEGLFFVLLLGGVVFKKGERKFILIKFSFPASFGILQTNLALSVSVKSFL